MRIALTDVSKSYGPLVVFRDLSFTIDDGEFVCLVGPSGCGKTTLLNIIGGLSSADGSDIEYSEPLEASYVFQSPRLLPWRTVEQNLKLVLKHSTIPRSEYDDRIRRHLDMVGLEGSEILDKYPNQLSGGMASRLGLVRGLIVPSNLVLMDEPLGDVDELTARNIRDDILKLWKGGGSEKTIVHVTHNVMEAVYLADRVLVLGQKPADIIADLEIDIDRPRRIDDDEIYSYQKRIFSELPS